MDQRKIIEYVVIDWGFTWLKLWLLNEEKIIIKNSSYETKSLTNTRIFYDACGLEKTFKLIKNFFRNCSDKAIIKVFYSCQMHGISGLLKNNEPFFSTWNDMPLRTEKNNEVNSNLGIPLISSMPNEKLIQHNNRYFLKTKISSVKYSREESEVSRLYDPFELIFKYFMNYKLKTSEFFWQASCLNDKDIAKINERKKTNQNLDLLMIKKENIISKLINGKQEIINYPCLGDLQASTYSAISNHDIVINFGTGSQVIFSKKYEHIPIINKYYRIYPIFGSLPALSHIPCGRLISEYCKIRCINFSDIKDSVKNLRYERYIEIIRISKIDLLFFPGFDANRLKYTNNPPTSIEYLSQYKPDQVISNWINQYILIINYIVNQSSNLNKINISIVGNLGGITNECIQLMNQITPSHVEINHSKYSLPLSIIDCFN